jgi:hypothetical protein
MLESGRVVNPQPLAVMNPQPMALQVVAALKVASTSCAAVGPLVATCDLMLSQAVQGGEEVDSAERAEE